MALLFRRWRPARSGSQYGRDETATQRFFHASSVADGYERFMTISRRLHEVSEKFFLLAQHWRIADTMEIGGAFSPQVLSDVMSLRMGRSVAGLVRSCVSDARAAQMIDHFTSM